MKIERLPSGSYRIRQTSEGHTYSIVLPYKPSQKEAIQLMAEKLEDENPKTALKGTFEFYAKKYISIQDNVLSPSTIRSYGHILVKISEPFKNKQIALITQADVQEEVNLYTVDHQPKTVRNFHAFISTVLRMYRPDFALHTNLPQKKKVDKYIPTPDEVNQVLEAVKGTRYYIPYRLSLYGLRRGELCALEVSDLSEENILTINKSKVLNEEKQWVVKPIPKTTESERSIYIDDELSDMIREQGFIYEGHPHRLYDRLKEVQDQLGIPRFRLHDFRAYFCTELSQAGVSEADIMRMGGWATPYIMKSVYRHSRIQSELDRQKEISKILSQYDKTKSQTLIK